MALDTDKKILAILNNNARKSFREIAKDVGISTTAVINAVKRMEKAGAIRGYIPLADPEFFGSGLTAVVAVRISGGRLIETQKTIAENPRVTAVYDVTGEWDSLIVGRFDGREDLNMFLKNLLAVPCVERTVTHIVLNVVKEDPRVFIPKAAGDP